MGLAQQPTAPQITYPVPVLTIAAPKRTIHAPTLPAPFHRYNLRSKKKS